MTDEAAASAGPALPVLVIGFVGLAIIAVSWLAFRRRSA